MLIKQAKMFYREFDECASVLPPFDCAVLCDCICCGGLNRSFLIFALLLVINLLLLIVVLLNVSPLFGVVVLK